MHHSGYSKIKRGTSDHDSAAPVSVTWNNLDILNILIRYSESFWGCES